MVTKLPTFLDPVCVGEVMSKAAEGDSLLREALRLMTAALDLLDEDGTVGAIGAQLDLARARLSEHLDPPKDDKPQ